MGCDRSRRDARRRFYVDGLLVYSCAIIVSALGSIYVWHLNGEIFDVYIEEDACIIQVLSYYT